MKRTGKLLAIVLIGLILYACDKDDPKLSYEPGTYKPYKQELSPVYAFADNKDVDGSRIRVTTPFIDDAKDPLRNPSIDFNSINLEKQNRARIYCPTCLNDPMDIHLKDDSLFLTPQNLSEAVKFAPYSETGFAVIYGEEAKRHSTLRCKITEEGFILSTYNIYIKSPGGTKGTTDAYYLDLDYLKGELRSNDTLVYIKKEIYFRK